MQCPKCGGESSHKDGVIKGKQRYRCKICDCRYTRSTRHGFSIEKHLNALALYREGLGFRAIGRLLGVSNVTALNWIRDFGETVKAEILSRPVDIEDMDVIVLDELWHCTQKKGGKSGVGLLYLCAADGSLPSKWALVVPKPLANREPEHRHPPLSGALSSQNVVLLQIPPHGRIIPLSPSRSHEYYTYLAMPRREVG